MNMGDRIKQLRIERGLTQEELGKVIGVQKSAIRKYEAGVVQNLKRSSIEKLANFFGVKPSFLMCLENEQEKKPNNILKDLLMIPVVGKIRAGEPILAEENIEDNFFISASMYNVHSPDGLFFLKVIGNSMNNVIPEGGYALIKQQDTAENGDIVVAIVNGDNEATLKRFKDLDNGFIMLEPDSSYEEYKPLIINLRDTEIKILGKVIGDFKKWG